MIIGIVLGLLALILFASVLGYWYFYFPRKTRLSDEQLKALGVIDPIAVLQFSSDWTLAPRLYSKLVHDYLLAKPFKQPKPDAPKEVFAKQAMLELYRSHQTSGQFVFSDGVETQIKTITLTPMREKELQQAIANLKGFITHVISKKYLLVAPRASQVRVAKKKTTLKLLRRQHGN